MGGWVGSSDLPWGGLGSATAWSMESWPFSGQPEGASLLLDLPRGCALHAACSWSVGDRDGDVDIGKVPSGSAGVSCCPLGIPQVTCPFRVLCNTWGLGPEMPS